MSILQEYKDLLQQHIQAYSRENADKLKELHCDETFSYLETLRDASILCSSNYYYLLHFEIDTNHLDAAGCILNQLGLHYYHGIGVPQSSTEAVKLYRQAADLIYPSSIYNLALAYQQGKGVVQNENEAIKLYKQAIDLKHTTSMYNLANLYYNTGNIRESLKLFSQAADLRQQRSIDFLDAREHNSYVHEIKRCDRAETQVTILESRLKTYTRLTSLDIGSLVYYDIKKYI
jgi:TPR repeat protein